MADLLGAAASCGMVALVMALFCNFLVHVGAMNADRLKGYGWVFGACSLFAAAEYGLMMLFHVVRYGKEAMGSLAEIVHHPMFAGIFEHPAIPAHYYMAGAWLAAALAGCFLYAALRAQMKESNARSGVVWLYMLPGMEFAVMPAGAALWVLAVCAGLWLIRKKLVFFAGKPCPAVPVGAAAVLGMMKAFILYGFVVGV